MYKLTLEISSYEYAVFHQPDALSVLDMVLSDGRRLHCEGYLARVLKEMIEKSSRA